MDTRATPALGRPVRRPIYESPDSSGSFAD